MKSSFKRSLFLGRSPLTFYLKYNHLTHYNDIVSLQKAEKLFFYIKNNRIEFTPTQTIQELKEGMKKNNPDINSVAFYEASTFSAFAEKSQVHEIIQNDFILQVNHHAFYKILVDLEKAELESLGAQRNYFTSDEKELFTFQNEMGSGKDQSLILANFVKSLINETKSLKSAKIDCYYINTIVKKIIGEMALKEKKREEDLDLQLKFLGKKINELTEKKEKVIERLGKKANKRINFFLGFTLTQVALIQYGTYSAFSWDIMEPITCLLGVLDLIIAYSFWLYSHRDYSFDEMNKHYISRRLSSKLNQEMKELSILKSNYEEEINLYERILAVTQAQKQALKTYPEITDI